MHCIKIAVSLQSFDSSRWILFHFRRISNSEFIVQLKLEESFGEVMNLRTFVINNEVVAQIMNSKIIIEWRYRLPCLHLVTVTQYRAIWLHWHFPKFPIGVSHSRTCLDKVTQYILIWIQWHFIPCPGRGCHCKQVSLYERMQFWVLCYF